MATIESPVVQTIAPITHDLGAFKVNRTLPARERTMVGPFIFVDEFGPARLPAGQGMDVRPHPHINLATVTYLFEGAIEHRDSIGSHQVIEPGAINLMTAGKGIVHSERSPQSLQRRRLPASGNFYLAARKIRHPSTQAEPPSLLADEPAKSDALHSAADTHMEEFHSTVAPIPACRTAART